MKILVCVSKTPDTTSKIAFKDGNSKFDDAGVQWIINPYDEWYALVRAIELKEKDPSTVIHLVTVGAADTEPIIRKALALGGDEAIRVNTDSHDSFYIASQIVEVAKQGSYDLVFTGKETIDYNGGVVGGMLAELLDLPYISLASKLDVDGSSLKIERELEGVKETVTANMPCVISAQKGMAEARIPNMRGILASKTKPVTVIAADGSPVKAGVKSFAMPAEKTGCKMISPDDAAQLVSLLHNEAKVI